MIILKEWEKDLLIKIVHTTIEEYYTEGESEKDRIKHIDKLERLTTKIKR